jgi:hypothetical protein
VIQDLSKESIIHFLTAIGRRQPSSSLRKLLLSGGESITYEAFAYLDRLEAAGLQLLSISFANGLGSRGMRAISRLAGLTTLIIHEARQLLTEDFVAAFAGGKLRELRHLELADCPQLLDECVDEVAISCPRLEELGLKRLDCMEDLSGMVTSARSLRTLRLVEMRYE